MPQDSIIRDILAFWDALDSFRNLARLTVRCPFFCNFPPPAKPDIRTSSAHSDEHMRKTMRRSQSAYMDIDVPAVVFICTSRPALSLASWQGYDAWSGSRPSSTRYWLSAQFREQCLRVSQIRRVETLGEPGEIEREARARLVIHPAAQQQPRERRGRTQFQ